jgi:hydrogenase-4 component B
MIAFCLIAAFTALFAGALIALACGNRSGIATICGVFGALLGGVFSVAGAITMLVTSRTFDMALPWSMIGGSLHIRFDPLSALFVLPVGILSACAAIYGGEYLSGNVHGTKLSRHWFFFNLLTASMLLIVIASDVLLFLVAWEIMSLTSFFLVMFDHEKQEVRGAGWMYLTATHIGVVFLLFFFLFAQQSAGTSSFMGMARHGFSGDIAGMLFVFALIGFGSKAGFVPFHVWLPEAHPAAPSHVSALMSGVMIKMGIYGIVRALTLIGPPPAWWGLLLIAIGAVSGILGVLYALGQHDLKRLLAYHSVENIGIITLGLGCGVLGVSLHNDILATLGFGGALLHVINHALFKGLLFLGAGAVLHRTKTLMIERLGGLVKKMPVTAACFLIGSIAICGIPPLNGFVSEFMIFSGAFYGSTSPAGSTLLACTATILSLALIGGLALACFTKAFGIVFLGEPRTAIDTAVKDPGPAMIVPMILLGFFCIFIGIGFFLIARVFKAPVALLSGLSADQVRGAFAPAALPLFAITLSATLLIFVIGIAAFFRYRLLRYRIVRTSVTWDCGYTRPTARMQYTATSFAQPLLDFFGRAVAHKKTLRNPAGYFPKDWKFNSHLHDVFLDRCFRPLFRGVEWGLEKLRWFQGGKVHLYVMYIALTMIALLVWELVWNR